MGKIAIGWTFSRRNDVAVSILNYSQMLQDLSIFLPLSDMSYRRPLNSQNSSLASFKIHCYSLMSTLAVAMSPIPTSIYETAP
jgi:hypothetical protein